MKVLMENFIETMGNQMVATDKLEYYHYREEEREKEEDALRNAALKKQHGMQSIYNLVLIFSFFFICRYLW